MIPVWTAFTKLIHSIKKLGILMENYVVNILQGKCLLDMKFNICEQYDSKRRKEYQHENNTSIFHRI